jgi:hypothetical protein
MRSRLLAAPLLVLAFAAAAAGCGGDDDKAGKTPGGGAGGTAAAGTGTSTGGTYASGKPDPAAEWRAATAKRCESATPDREGVPKLSAKTLVKYSVAQRKVAVARRSKLREGERPKRVESSVHTLLLNYDLYAQLLDRYGKLKGSDPGDAQIAKSLEDLEGELQDRADRLKVGPCGPTAD